MTGSDDREELEAWIDRYLDAAIANEPGRLPVTDDVRFTENGQRLRIGEGLWRSLCGVGSYRLVVTDVPAGVVTMIGTVREHSDEHEDGLPTTIALRLAIENDRVDEIEQMVLRRDAETAEAIEELGKPREAFYTSVPQPMTRGELITTANTYFSALQRRGPYVTCPVTEDCHRIENGEPTTNVPVPEGETAPDPEEATTYSYHWTTRQQLASGLTKFVTRIRDRRFVSVDRERGLVFAFGFFDHAAGETRTFETADGRTVTTGPEQPWTWYIAEIFKVEDGKLSEIEAIMREVPYGMTSGWSNRVEGMSDEPRNVTGVPES